MRWIQLQGYACTTTHVGHDSVPVVVMVPPESGDVVAMRVTLPPVLQRCSSRYRAASPQELFSKSRSPCRSERMEANSQSGWIDLFRFEMQLASGQVISQLALVCGCRSRRCRNPKGTSFPMSW